MTIRHTFGDEDNRPDAMPAGVYPATIKDAEEKISKSSGNDMIEIVWALESGLLVFDYLTFGPKTAFKVDTFLKAVGLAPEKGADVEIVAADLIGKQAFLDLIIEPGTCEYRAKNKVNKYVCEKGTPSAPSAVAGTKKDDDDDLPF